MKRGHKAFLKKSELENIYIYIYIIYRTISFYRQHLEITCKLSTPVRLEVTGLSDDPLLRQTLKTSLGMNLVNIFN